MSWIDVTYHLRGKAAAVAARAQAIAVEQSIEMPPETLDNDEIVSNILGRVTAVKALEPDLHAVRVQLAAATVGADAGQLLNMLFGNSSLHDDLTLVDAELPASLQRELGSGPRAGLRGLRARVNAGARALTASALKPQGLPSADLAKLAHAFALGGIDYVKDDHGLAQQSFSPFHQRVSACAAAIRQAAASTGHHTRYVPSLSGSLDAARDQLRILREEGLDTAMVAPAILGLSNVQQLVRDHRDIAFLAHPSLSGAARIAPALLAKLWRLIGLDAVIFPNHGGRFDYSPETCRQIAAAARTPSGELAAALPVPAGGLSLARVPEVLDFYGDEVMLLIGGNLLVERERLTEATAAFVGQVHNHAGANVHA